VKTVPRCLAFRSQGAARASHPDDHIVAIPPILAPKVQHTDTVQRRGLHQRPIPSPGAEPQFAASRGFGQRAPYEVPAPMSMRFTIREFLAIVIHTRRSTDLCETNCGRSWLWRPRRDNPSPGPTIAHAAWRLLPPCPSYFEFAGPHLHAHSPALRICARGRRAPSTWRLAPPRRLPTEVMLTRPGLPKVHTHLAQFPCSGEFFRFLITRWVAHLALLRNYANTPSGSPIGRAEFPDTQHLFARDASSEPTARSSNSRLWLR